MIPENTHLKSTIFYSELPFLDRALEAYKYQVKNNPVYGSFSKAYYSDQDLPKSIEDIPLIPIRAFKDTEMIAKGFTADLVFKSSGTGSMNRSHHLVARREVYETSVLNGFTLHFNLNDHILLCYTPGYSDNPDSSLLWMLDFLIRKNEDHLSRFLPLNQPLQQSDIEEIVKTERSILLFGAAFGLLDLIDLNSSPLPEGSHIIETGGMKTHRREMKKSELRNTLADGFKIQHNHIHSEYGMCELLSQMYAIGCEWFSSPHWVHPSVRDPYDPFRICSPGEEGKIGIIDLANIYSCPFILTEDRGVMNNKGEIAVLGRWHGAELRGCNFLIDRD